MTNTEPSNTNDVDKYYSIVEWPLGWIMILANDSGIIRVSFERKEVLIDEPENQWTQKCAIQIKEYLSGKRTEFDVPLSLDSYGKFYQSVWSELLKIPFGDTTTYGQIALDLKNPKSVRAVGTANGKNPIPIIVPCHRVVGKSGDLVGFSGGLDVKKWLLRHEIKHSETKVGMLF